MFIDTHTHLSCKEMIGDIQKHIFMAQQAGLDALINISCHPEEQESNIAFAHTYSTDTLPIYATLGYHPDLCNDPEDEQALQKVTLWIEAMQRNLERYPHIVAIGECGLDYYRTYHKRAQQKLFEEQIRLAETFHKPVIIHLRGEIWEDFYEILAKHTDLSCVIHCFSGTASDAQRLLKTFPNMYLSFTGIITFKNAQDTYIPILQETPINRILIETDSPYLAPVPYRGQQNTSAYVVEVAKKIAEVKQLSLEEVGSITTQNAKKFFGIL